MSFSREVRDFYRYFFKLKPEQKEILFYSEAASYFSYMEGALEELLSRGEHVCYVTSDPEDPIFDRKSELLTPLYQRSLLPYFLVLLNSPVCVMTLTELHKYHLKRSSKDVKYVYLFHAMMSTHMIYREGSFDHYDSILCVSPNQIEELRKREKDAKLPEKELVEGGYYRLERIHKAFQNYKAPESDGTTILIAPSWGEKNLLNSDGEELTRLLLEEGYHVILRPHPEQFKRSRDLIESIDKKFSSHPKFTLERSTGGDESMLRADVLVVDWSGIALEYAFGTQRPVLYMDLPPKTKNPNYKDYGLEPFEFRVRRVAGLVCDGPAEAPSLIKQLLEQKEDYKQKINSLREENIFHFGESSKIAADTIVRHKNRSSS